MQNNNVCEKKEHAAAVKGMPMQACAVTLSGQGDTEIYLVDEATMAWINCGKQTGRNGAAGWEDQDLPPALAERYLKAMEDEGEDPELPQVTCGSLDNDRALNARWLALSVDGEQAIFYCPVEMASFINKHGIEVTKVFSGCIY